MITIFVTPEIVRKVGDGDGAIVYCRMRSRIWGILEQTTSPGAQRENTVAWWTATPYEIAEEIGLTPVRVRRALAKLESRGLIESTELHLHGPADRQKSYRTLEVSRVK